MLKVRIVTLAESAYAAIVGDDSDGAFSLDVRLDRGVGAVTAMKRAADEMREKAARLIRTAQRIESASNLI